MKSGLTVSLLFLLSFVFISFSLSAQQPSTDSNSAQAAVCDAVGAQLGDGSFVIEFYEGGIDRAERIGGPECLGNIYGCDNPSGGDEIIKKASDCNKCKADHCEGCCAYHTSNPTSKSRCCAGQCGVPC